MKNKDVLTRFIFDNIPVRGAIIQLDDAWKTLLARKDYPDIVQTQLGEFLAANALLASTLKLNGALVMQIQGNGPINFMVMECTSDKHLRGMAQYKENVAGNSLSELFGDGQLLITIDNKASERYQSIVALDGEKISHALEAYLQQSEQLETHIILATNEHHACGLLVQKLPEENSAFDSNENDDWNRIAHLATTIKEEELVSLEPEEILHRLFHEDDIRILDFDSYEFKCLCSRERVANMLVSLGKAEVDSIIEERNTIEIDCEFCSQHYHFDSVDAEEIFATDIRHNAPEKKQ